MNTKNAKRNDAEATRTEVPREPSVLFDRWSSHPESLECQRKKWLAIGLVPLAIGALLLALLLTGASGWRTVLAHPGTVCWIAAGLTALSLGLVATFALLLMMGRAGIAQTTVDKDRIPFPKKVVACAALYWILPASLSCGQKFWGVHLVPQQVLFILNALCVAPIVFLLWWVQSQGNDRKEGKKKRHAFASFVLLYVGLAGVSLLGDLQGWLASLKLPGVLEGLSPLARRAAMLAALLPVSLVVWALWRLFRSAWESRKKTDDSCNASEEDRGARKPWWRRLWEFLFGEVQEQELDTDEESEANKPPAWLAQFCAQLPEGVRVASRNPPAPDPLPADESPVSPVSDAPDSEAFWLFMGGEESRRPTESQMEFFRRFRLAWGESLQAAKNGLTVASDIVLAGDEGSGRTEALFAASLYAAFARRQRVLYLVSDLTQAETLEKTANARFRGMFLDAFLGCGILDADKAKRWTRAFKPTDDGEKAEFEVDANALPPDIVLATPRLLERVFFEGRGADSDSASLEALASVLRLFEVVIVDDFTELDVVERAHLPFLLHKMRLLLESGSRRPQFVVATPRLRGDEGIAAVGQILGPGFDVRNAVTLRPRQCRPAWSLPLVVADGVDFEKAGDELAKRCLSLRTKDGVPPLRVVLYRRGLHPDQCAALAAKLAATPEARETLRVVSRLDELGDDRNADAVFYPTTFAGRSELAFRLSVGDTQTVYVSLSTESEALFADASADGILPALPDSSAVGLRIHHLRSVLRHVCPGQPLDLSVWERFGVFLESERLSVADPDEGAVAYETWFQDVWTEPSYGEPPLWPYIVFESHPSTKSNAGKGTDFGLIPATDEDVVRLGDTSRMGLARPKGADGRTSTASGSIARWIDGQGIDRGAVDLAHAEALVFGRSAMGDTVTSLAKGTGSAYTVQTFKPPKADAAGGEVCRLQMIPWHGSGRDLDTPVRKLEWFVEPGGAPLAPELDTARAVTYFELPDFRGMPRTVDACIAGLASRTGEMRPLMPPQNYSYDACFSGLLLAPRRLSSSDGPAQIQRNVAGPWNTADETFSWVLTHLFTGALARFIPDFSFYALLPVFHQHGREGAVAPAIAWLVQPRNTGRTIEPLVRSLLQPRGPATFFDVLREARRLFESRPDAQSRLRWLRSFSRSAFECDLDDPAVARAFESDIQSSFALLDALEERLAGRLGEIEGFSGPAPVLPRDTSWMSAPREFDVSGLQDASCWKSVGKLPSPPVLGSTDVRLEWGYAGKKFTLDVGFAAKEYRSRYVGFFGDHFRRRISGDCYSEYGFNDPYREFTGELAGHLLEMCDRAFPKATATRKAEFLLSFVQESLPYEYDPKNVSSDWPRHPSETLLRFGGDCEDTSILCAELLRRSGIGSAILSVPEHAAVGINVPMEFTSEHKKPIVYTWLGKAYVYGETACNKFCTPLGKETELIPSAERVRADIIPTPVLTEDDETPIRILNAAAPNSGSLTITMLAVRDVPGPLAVVVFARPRKEVFAEPVADAYPCVGGALLPTLKPFEVMEANLKLSSPKFNAFWYDVFVCETEGGAVRGHFVGVVRYQ